MRPMLALCLFAILLSQPVYAQTSNEKTNIDLVWVEEMDRVSPDPKNNIVVQRNVNLVLNGNNEVDQSTENKSGSKQSKSAKSSPLGKDWRVGSANTLIGEFAYPHHVRMLTVSIDGKRCTLEVSHNLKNGFSVYVTKMLLRPGENGYYSRIVTKYARCSIS